MQQQVNVELKQKAGDSEWEVMFSDDLHEIT